VPIVALSPQIVRDLPPRAPRQRRIPRCAQRHHGRDRFDALAQTNDPPAFLIDGDDGWRPVRIARAQRVGQLAYAGERRGVAREENEAAQAAARKNRGEIAVELRSLKAGKDRAARERRRVGRAHHAAPFTDVPEAS
jgi:hypothetical protein